MRSNRDLVRGWLLKAANDVKAVEISLDADISDVACFHGQQAAEKYLKAFLTFHEREFAYTHNLSKLVLLCERIDQSLAELHPLVEPLTPYAVELRYDAEFWPARSEAEEALKAVYRIRTGVLARLPADILDVP